MRIDTPRAGAGLREGEGEPDYSISNASKARLAHGSQDDNGNMHRGQQGRRELKCLRNGMPVGSVKLQSTGERVRNQDKASGKRHGCVCLQTSMTKTAAQ